MKSDLVLVIKTVGSVGRWKTKHFMGMASSMARTVEKASIRNSSLN